MIVVVHGFSNSSRTPEVYRFAHSLSRWAHVVALDLRGHGASGGRCSLGEREADDVDGAVHAAQDCAPGIPVVLVGISLGGTACLLSTGRSSARGKVAGVVAVSAPGWRDTTRPASARLHRWASSPGGRLLLRVLSGTRVARPRSTIDCIAGPVSQIAPAFCIVVHDPEEVVFGPEHAERLYAWATGPKELWWIPGAGHGRSVLTDAFAVRVQEAIERRLAARQG